MKYITLATILFAVSAGTAQADPESFNFDPSHSTIKFSWNHGGFSQSFGMFFDVQGSIALDQDDPAASMVTASVPLGDMLVQPTLKSHLGSDRWFGSLDGKMVEFASTSVEMTGENTAKITGDLSMNGQTKEIVLDALLNSLGEGPRGGVVAGFDATTTILRSDYGVGAFTPFVSDEIEVEISVEASPA